MLSIITKENGKFIKCAWMNILKNNNNNETHEIWKEMSKHIISCAITSFALAWSFRGEI